MNSRNLSSYTAFEQLYLDSDRFAQLASGLSDRIEQIENWLVDLPGKLAVTALNGRGIALSFTRFSGKWQLSVEWQDPDTGEGGSAPLREASLSMKAEGAKLLPTLVDELFRVQSAELESLNEAHAALDQVNSMLSKRLDVGEL